MVEVRVGISGWTYPAWRGVFYPRGLPHRQELAHVASLMRTVEINGSFYSLQRPSSFLAWRSATPGGFVFAVKGGRFITHMKKLVGVETAMANFLASGVLALGPKLGPLLWQLPPMLGFDPDRLAGFFASLPRTTDQAAALAGRHDQRLKERPYLGPVTPGPLRHALEVRHPSYQSPDFVSLLREHDIGLVIADTAGKWPLFDETTSDFVYVRLHGDVELYTSGYTDEALDAWAAKVRRWVGHGLDVYVYFDNDAKVHAPFDALRLADRLGVGPPGSA